MEAKKKSWTSALFAYAEGEKKQLILSVILSVLSVMLGLVPFYCMYALICLFVAGTATAALAVKWCLLALLAYAVKILLFSLSTGTSHAMAYTILEGLRLRLADRFLHAPLGNMENHTIGEIKSMMMDKIENLEPPLAHMIPEGAGHVVLPVVSIIALLCIDWRLAFERGAQLVRVRVFALHYQYGLLTVIYEVVDIVFYKSPCIGDFTVFREGVAMPLIKQGSKLLIIIEDIALVHWYPVDVHMLCAIGKLQGRRNTQHRVMGRESLD